MATYTQQCTKVGSFSYAGNFTLYVVLNDRDGNSSTNKSQVDYNVYCQSSGSGSISARHRRYFSLNGSTIIDTTETINASSPNAYIPIASGTMEITHNDDGSKKIPFSAIIQGATYGVSASISGDFTLNTIPRASSISCSTANIEENAVITISSASNSFTHTVIAYFGNETVTVATGKSGGSFQWTIPSSFYAQIPNAKTGAGTIRCQTYNGSTLVGTKDAVLNVSTSETRCKPNISGTVVDTNQTTIALTGNANKLIKYKSTAKATISASAKNSASISKKAINGTTVSGNELSIANVSTASFNFETVDSRGYSNSSTVTPSMVNYIPLTINANFFRPQPTTGEVKLTYSGNYFNGSFGAVANTLSITWKYKKQGATAWTTGGTITPTLSGNTISSKTISLGTNFDYQTAYDFQIIATDKLTTFTQTANVSVGMPVFYWGKDFMSINQKLLLKDAPANFGGCREVTVANSYVRLFTYKMTTIYKNTSIWFTLCDTQSANENILCNLYARCGSSTAGVSVTKFAYIDNKGSFDFSRLVAVVIDSNTIEVYFKMNSNDSPAISILSMTKLRENSDAYGKITIDCSTTVTTLPSGTATKPAAMVSQPISLFDNSSGTSGTVTLSESAANFSYLEIFYGDSTNGAPKDSLRAYSPNGAVVNSSILSQSDTDIRVNTRRLTISETTITPACYQVNYLPGGSKYSVNEQKIYKVLGYK